MLKVFQENDKVMIDLCGRKRDVLLSPLEAEKLADSLEENAGFAEQAEPRLYLGQRWEANVSNRDKLVVIRFRPPNIYASSVVPLPPEAARQIADLLRTNANFAGFGLRIERV